MIVGSFEAKNKLSALLERAENGEEVVITRRGKPVAKLVPMSAGMDQARAREAAVSIRALAGKLKLKRYDWDEWKQYRDEGRK